MSCSAYVSYQLDGDENASPGVLVNSVLPAAQKQKPASQNASTSFVLVDPSNSNSKGGGKDAKRSIRKHAASACAAQRLATIAERKKAQNVLSKRERQRQQAAQRLEAALQHHARKFAPIKEEYPEIQKAEPSSATYEGDAFDSSSKRMSDAEPNAMASHTEAPFDDCGRKKCSIPWLLANLPPSGKATTPTAAVSKAHTQQDVLREPSPRSLDVYSPQLNTLAFTPLALNVDRRERFLLDFMFNSMFPLMDMRLPNKADNVSRSRYAWQNDLPRLVLSSEPLFWTILLCSGTLEALWIRKLPDALSWNVKYRHLAICSVNRRLQAPEHDLVLDSGLISAIATLGVWERQRGSKEIWLAHRRGVETLTQKLRERKEHDLVRQMVASCHLPDVQPWVDNHSEGFKRLRNEILLDHLVVSAVCRCPHIESIELGQSRVNALETEATEILKYTTSSAVSGRVEGSAGNRISLEMNVLLQGAGVSMIKFMGRDLVGTRVDQIDFPEMCRETVGLGKSISSNPAYDDLLLWAVFTMYALNSYTDSEGLDIVVKLARRLEIASWLCLENLLREFVYLETAALAYQETWLALEPHLDQQAEHDGKAAKKRRSCKGTSMTSVSLLEEY